MINLFLTLIIIFAFICILTVIIGIKSQKTLYPMVSVICGVMIIAFAFCCAIETESPDSEEVPSKAFIPASEYESGNAGTDLVKESATRKAAAAEAHTQAEEEDEFELEDDAEKEEIPVERVITEEDAPDDMSRTVYITKTGTKYHYSYFCSNTDFYECTLEQALARGLEPCKKCVK